MSKAKAEKRTSREVMPALFSLENYGDIEKGDEGAGERITAVFLPLGDEIRFIRRVDGWEARLRVYVLRAGTLVPLFDGPPDADLKALWGELAEAGHRRREERRAAAEDAVYRAAGCR